eukprot:TRINITY_DN2926_c0_g1_i1.p1 TRINITY_DN2926_c0_g1~~TRINITY_DN2926_c0_g1_i1.p1  ORF type:complete len:405 (-),score=112.69 TRINITY_DN2926_c0_g1_i1:478-1692(-)
METMTMPLILMNMGGEMLYILEQRLRAQSIAEEKAARVLRDVISTMFSDKFVSELFRLQPMYSNASTRLIFDRLAHSSIMRLNESSMDKLYDLMTMGFKYQVLSCVHPSDLIQVTLNHLDALRALVKSSTETVKLIDKAQQLFLDTYKSLTEPQCFYLRQALCRFFQERKVKVSLFLQDGIQSLDGAIIIFNEGSLPPHTQLPGTIRYYDASDSQQIKEEKVALRNAANVSIPATDSVFDISKAATSPRPCKLGFNLYARDRKKSSKPSSWSSSAKQGKDLEGKDFLEGNMHERESAKKELNTLAQLVGIVPSSSVSSDKDKFNIVHLFHEDSDDKKSNAMSDVICMDGDESNFVKKRVLSLLKELNLEDKKDQSSTSSSSLSSSSKGAKAEDDDLLSLMDNAL